MTAQMDSDITSQKWQIGFKFDRMWMQHGDFEKTLKGA